MTSIALGPEKWQLEFTEAEALFLITIFSQLAQDYRQDLDELPPAQQAYWQGRGTLGLKPNESESSGEILSEMRQELRSERLVLVEDWLQNYKNAAQHNPWRVQLNLAQRDELICLLNDRRLLLALQFGLAEEDVEHDLESIKDEDRRTALWEIGVLGHLIFTLIGPQIYKP